MGVRTSDLLTHYVIGAEPVASVNGYWTFPWTCQFADRTIHGQLSQTCQFADEATTTDMPIAQFAITINSNVCPHIWVPNMLMRESYA